MSTPEGQTTKFDQCTSVANFTREGFAGEDPMNKQTKILAGAFLFFWGGGGSGRRGWWGGATTRPCPAPSPASQAITAATRAACFRQRWHGWRLRL